MRRSIRRLFDAAAELVFPGAQVWDLGANVGLFAFASAFLAGEKGGVRAVEPDPFLASLLRRSAASQPAGRAPVEVIEAAATATAGAVEFQIAERGRAANHLATVEGSSQAFGYDVFGASVPAADRMPLDAAPWNTLAVAHPWERVPA